MNKISKTKKFFKTSATLIALLGISHSAFALTAPWYRLQAQIKATLEADPCVHVSNLTGQGLDMKIVVDVCNYNKAQALAAFISKQVNYNPKQTVTVSVTANQTPVTSEPPANGSQAIALLKTALEGNKYFVETGEYNNSNWIYAEFKPVVVQYYSNDISDRYGRTNLVAAESFKQVLNVSSLIVSGIRVSTSTSIVKN